MIVKKGTKVLVKSARKGNHEGILDQDLDIDEFNKGEKDIWVEVKCINTVYGLREDWEKGESVPCRSGLNKIEVLKGE